MKKELLVTCLSLVILATWGQTDRRYIEVMGSAESEVTPNVIVISVRLKEYLENKEKIALEKIEADFLNAVAKSNISNERIAVSDLTLNSIQHRRKDRDFVAQKTYEISFSKTEDVMILMDNLKTVKLDYLDIVKLSHTDIEKYRLETKIQALKAAEKKADALLSSVGAKRGKLLFIDETQGAAIGTLRPGNIESNILYNIVDNESMGISEIPLKKIKLKFEILARFEIE